MPLSWSRGVMEYWGKLLWKKRAFATLGRDMTPSCRSSLLGMRLTVHLMASFMVDSLQKRYFEGDLVCFQGHDNTEKEKCNTKTKNFLGKLKKCQRRWSGSGIDGCPCADARPDFPAD